MRKPSREIIENARKAANIDNEDCNCAGLSCTADICPYVWERSKQCSCLDSTQKYFKDFLAKYDTEDTMFKVGDKVRVRSDLVVGKDYGTHSWVHPMASFAGQIVTIAVVGEGSYRIRETGFNWTSQMLERIYPVDTDKEIAELKARVAKLEGELKAKEPAKQKYPCIKRTPGGCTVYFIAPGEGTCINIGETSNRLWYVSSEWHEPAFTETLPAYTIKV